MQRQGEQIQDHNIMMQWQGEQIQDCEITMQWQVEQIQDCDITITARRVDPRPDLLSRHFKGSSLFFLHQYLHSMASKHIKQRYALGNISTSYKE